jgi:hypothetical protein
MARGIEGRGSDRWQRAVPGRGAWATALKKGTGGC